MFLDSLKFAGRQPDKKSANRLMSYANPAEDILRLYTKKQIYSEDDNFKEITIDPNDPRLSHLSVTVSSDSLLKNKEEQRWSMTIYFDVSVSLFFAMSKHRFRLLKAQLFRLSFPFFLCVPASRVRSSKAPNYGSLQSGEYLEATLNSSPMDFVKILTIMSEEVNAKWLTWNPY